MAAIKRVDILEEFYEKDSRNYNVDFLAKLLHKNKQELASALGTNSSTISKNGIDADNKVMKQWMQIFNLIIDQIEESDLDLDKVGTQTKIARHLRLSNPDFANNSLLEIMMSGKARKVIRFLEQNLR